MSQGSELIKAHFPTISEQKLSLLLQYADLLLETNQRINLISRKDTEHVHTRHILHSLSIAKVNDFAPEQRVLDVGTGGGLPGIPLAIMNPETEFYLVDSIGKKINAVKEMAEELGGEVAVEAEAVEAPVAESGEETIKIAEEVINE